MMDQQYMSHPMTHGKVSYNFNPTNQMMMNNVKTDNILFVADLPEETSEEDLENFFKNYNFMVAKLIRNMNRVHAFVSFDSRESAEKARYELNGVKITAKYSTHKISKPVRLCRYETKMSQTENQRDPSFNLLIKNIGRDISQHNFWRLFRDFGDIRSCKLAIDYVGNNKGFGFVNFYRSEDAEKAKRELNGKEIQGKELKVTNLEYGRRVEKKKNNVYVKHLPLDNYSDDDLKKLFERFGAIKSAVVIKDGNNKSKGFGFVCFESPQAAEEACSKMRDQKLFEGCAPLYLNFAMKKSERQEILLKKKEELYRMAQKMTIFAKIKDENSVKDESEFRQKIINTLKLILGVNYEPKSLKIRFDTKNAFITMNSQREAEEFIRKINDPSKKSILSEIFFSLYKSKVERIHSNATFKRYNDVSKSLSGPGMGLSVYKSFNNFESTSTPNSFSQGSRYKSYNQEYLNPPQVSNFQQNLYNQPKQMNQFNNFDNSNRMMQQPQSNYNNLNEPMMGMSQQQQMMNRPVQQQAPSQQKPKLNVQTMSLDDIGDFIYSYCEKLYPNEAPKITGMIIELPEDNLRFLISEENLVHLDDLIKNAYLQCKESA